MIDGDSINFVGKFICRIVFLLLFVAPNDTRSWDIAVASDVDLRLFDLDGNVESTPLSNLTDVRALAYDPVRQRLFFSVSKLDAGILAYDLENGTASQVVALPEQKFFVLGIAYDATTSTLFWTDGRGRSIWRKSLANETSQPEKLLYLEDEMTTGIAVSLCKRLLFWTNSNNLAGSIDRSNLDGGNHTKIITTDVFQPLGITVDEPYGKIYWTDDGEGIYYRIERSNLDGTGRELIIQGTHQEPFAIVATNNAIYWTDSVHHNVWVLSTDMSFPNHTKARFEPAAFHKCSTCDPNGIVAYGEPDCSVSLELPKLSDASENGEDAAAAAADADYCLNGGEFVESGCRCRKGFSGKRCEVSACYNYCLNEGSCRVDGGGFPECACRAGYVGSRCDVDVCEGFCLNGGRCYVNDTSVACSCRDGFDGDRCELTRELFCHGVCLDPGATPLAVACDCESIASAFVASSDFLQMTNASQCKAQQFVITLLTVFFAFSMIVIFVLAQRIFTLLKRPRIKKRFIVNKTIKSQTPMTVRPHATSPTEQCEITIENCCNMNICETPCFEPNLRTSRSTPSSLMKKTEDRKKLLKNMEEETGEMDDGYT